MAAAGATAAAVGAGAAAVDGERRDVLVTMARSLEAVLKGAWRAPGPRPHRTAWSATSSAGLRAKKPRGARVKPIDSVVITG